MTVDARIARGGALAVWAVFFIGLWLTGTSDRFLGTRTQWIVPFGAVVLALAVLAYGYGYLRSRRRGPRLTLREASGLFALLIPLAAVALVPHAALGSYAAARNGTGSFFLSARPPVPSKPADASFLDIRIAEHRARPASAPARLRHRLEGRSRRHLRDRALLHLLLHRRRASRRRADRRPRAEARHLDRRERLAHAPGETLRGRAEQDPARRCTGAAVLELQDLRDQAFKGLSPGNGQ